MAKFEERLKKVHEPLEQAQALGEDPEMYSSLIGLAVAEGNPQAAREPFAKGFKLSPRYSGVCLAMTNLLLPQWYGAAGDVKKFAELVRKQLGGDEGEEMYFYIACVLYQFKPEGFFKDSGFTYADLLPGIRASL